MSMLAIRLMLVSRRFSSTMSPMPMGALRTRPRMRFMAWAWSAQRDGLSRAHRQQRLVAAGDGHGRREHARGTGELLMCELIAARAVIAGYGAHFHHGAIGVALHLYGQKALGWAGRAVELQRFAHVIAHSLCLLDGIDG